MMITSLVQEPAKYCVETDSHIWDSPEVSPDVVREGRAGILFLKLTGNLVLVG